jgi:hypothetical protein
MRSTYIEWRAEQGPFREILLYFQELYMAAFLEEYFFSKGHITSARKVGETCDKYELDRFKYVFTCFTCKKDEIRRVGFRYFNAVSYQKVFVDKALDPTWYGYATSPTPIFDRIKREVNNISLAKVSVVDGLLNGSLSPEALSYLIRGFKLDYEDFKDVIEPLASTFARPEKRVTLWMKRGVLPRDPDDMSKFTNFEAWCRQPSKSGNEKKTDHTKE